MNILKRPEALALVFFTLTIGFGLVPGFIQTAGVLGRWDLLCSLLLLASFASTVVWLLIVQSGRPESVARWGWIIPTMLLISATSACLKRHSLAEAELKNFGIIAQRHRAYDSLSKLLGRIGVQWDVIGRWEHLLLPPSIGSQEELEKVAELLAIHRPEAVTLSCGESIQNLSPFTRLKGLIALEIEMPSALDFRPVGELPNLLSLTVKILEIEPGTRLNLNPLANLPKLGVLNITSPGAEVEMRAVGQLRRLSINGLASSELGAQLPDSGALEELYIANASSLTGFTKGRVLPKLRHLQVGGTRTPLSLKALPEFAPSLESLGFEACHLVVDLEEIARLPKLGLFTVHTIPHFVPRLPELKTLKTFVCADSEVVSLDEIARVAPNLFGLTIKQQTPSLDLEGFKRLPLLGRLDLFHCEITPNPEHLKLLGGRPQYTLPRSVTRRVSKTGPSQESTHSTVQESPAR